MFWINVLHLLRTASYFHWDWEVIPANKSSGQKWKFPALPLVSSAGRYWVGNPVGETVENLCAMEQWYLACWISVHRVISPLWNLLESESYTSWFDTWPSQRRDHGVVLKEPPCWLMSEWLPGCCCFRQFVGPIMSEAAYIQGEAGKALCMFFDWSHWLTSWGFL